MKRMIKIMLSIMMFFSVMNLTVKADEDILLNTFEEIGFPYNEVYELRNEDESIKSIDAILSDATLIEVSNTYMDVLDNSFEVQLPYTEEILLSNDNQFLDEENNVLHGVAYKVNVEANKTYLFNITSSRIDPYFETYMVKKIDGIYEVTSEGIEKNDESFVVHTNSDEELYLFVVKKYFNQEHFREYIKIDIREYKDLEVVDLRDSTESFVKDIYEYDSSTKTLILREGTLDEVIFYADSSILLNVLIEGDVTLNCNYREDVIYVEKMNLTIGENSSLTINTVDIGINGNDISINGIDNSKLAINSSRYSIYVNKLKLNYIKSEFNEEIVIGDIHIPTDEIGFEVYNSDISTKSSIYNRTKGIIDNSIIHAEKAIYVSSGLNVTDSFLYYDGDEEALEIEYGDVVLKNTYFDLNSKYSSVVDKYETSPKMIFENDDYLVMFKSSKGKVLGIEDNFDSTWTETYFNINDKAIYSLVTVKKEDVEFISTDNGMHIVKLNGDLVLSEICSSSSDLCEKCNGKIIDGLEFIVDAERELENEEVYKDIDKLHSIDGLTSEIVGQEAKYYIYDSFYNVITKKGEELIELENVWYDISNSMDDYYEMIVYVNYGDKWEFIEDSYNFSESKALINFKQTPVSILILRKGTIEEKLYQFLADFRALNKNEYDKTSFETYDKTVVQKVRDALNDGNATEEYMYEILVECVNGYRKLEKKKEEIPMTYADIKEDQWFYGSVKKAFELGLMSKLKEVEGQDYFGPDVNISRGMVATVLYRMDGLPNATFNATFSDVTNGNLWYAKAITWASENKVVSGYKDGRFGPDDNITRQDLAIMLRNYAASVGLNTNVAVDFGAFKDGEAVVDYAATAVQFCVDAGLMSGSKKSDGTYLMPTANATRAECAKMFSLLNDLIKAK